MSDWRQLSLAPFVSVPMDEILLLLFCCVIAFVSGYGVRALISLRRRREVRKIREARERLMQAKASN